MPTMYDDVNVKCPFFQTSDKTRITCEGITDDCTLNIKFATKATRNKHHELFCGARYENCEVYRMLKDKYEG